MNLILALLLALATPAEAYAATAIATCESGNTVDFGTYDWTARSKTSDGGAFQFNDKTWHWLTNHAQADKGPPSLQVQQFIKLWGNGKGTAHWASSESCWSKWIDEEGNAVDRNHYDIFVWLYVRLQTKEQTKW